MPNQNWVKFESSGLDKAKWHWVRKLIYGFLAGFFVGIGFTAMIIMEKKMDDGSYDPILSRFLGSTIFCVGILMCIFVGGSLYTANCTIYSGVLTKKVKRSVFYKDLLITFVGNYLGSITIALMIYGIGVFDDAAKKAAYEIAVAKIEADWWKTFLSGIITNVLVVGCIVSFTIFDNKIIGFFATLIMITAFAVCGFQHVVANMYITTMGGLLGVFNNNGALVGKLFYQCLLMSLLGNFVGGIFLTYCYYLSWNKFQYRKENK